MSTTSSESWVSSEWFETWLTLSDPERERDYQPMQHDGQYLDEAADNGS